MAARVSTASPSTPDAPPPPPRKWGRRGLGALFAAGVIGAVAWLLGDDAPPPELPKNDAVSVFCRSMAFAGASKGDPCRFSAAVNADLAEATRQAGEACVANRPPGGMVGGAGCREVGVFPPDPRKLAVIYWSTASSGDVKAVEVEDIVGGRKGACALAGFPEDKCPANLGWKYNFR